MIQIPHRFGLRAMLAAVALVAVTIVVTRDCVRLQSAREHYQRIYASWQANRITLGAVVSESFPLMDAEESTLWISERTAKRHQADRLKHILEQTQSNASEAMPEEKRRRAKYIIEQIRNVDPAAADELTEKMTQAEVVDEVVAP